LGEFAERDRAAARARSLRSSMTSKQEIYDVDIALAQLANGPEQRGEAIKRLRDLANDAQRRQWIGWALEAKLAAWQLLRAGGNAAAASRARDELATEAGKRGYLRIIALLNAPAH
jgi:hypothetical protein